MTALVQDITTGEKPRFRVTVVLRDGSKAINTQMEPERVRVQLSQGERRIFRIETRDRRVADTIAELYNYQAAVVPPDASIDTSNGSDNDITSSSAASADGNKNEEEDATVEEENEDHTDGDEESAAIDNDSGVSSEEEIWEQSQDVYALTDMADALVHGEKPTEKGEGRGGEW